MSLTCFTFISGILVISSAWRKQHCRMLYSVKCFLKTQIHSHNIPVVSCCSTTAQTQCSYVSDCAYFESHFRGVCLCTWNHYSSASVSNVYQECGDVSSAVFHVLSCEVIYQLISTPGHLTQSSMFPIWLSCAHKIKEYHLSTVWAVGVQCCSTVMNLCSCMKILQHVFTF